MTVPSSLQPRQVADVADGDLSSDEEGIAYGPARKLKLELETLALCPRQLRRVEIDAGSPRG